MGGTAQDVRHRSVWVGKTTRSPFFPRCQRSGSCNMEHGHPSLAYSARLSVLGTRVCVHGDVLPERTRTVETRCRTPRNLSDTQSIKTRWCISAQNHPHHSSVQTCLFYRLCLQSTMESNVAEWNFEKDQRPVLENPKQRLKNPVPVEPAAASCIAYGRCGTPCRGRSTRAGVASTVFFLCWRLAKVDTTVQLVRSRHGRGRATHGDSMRACALGVA
jgi:hypothetical protein